MRNDHFFERPRAVCLVVGILGGGVMPRIERGGYSRGNRRNRPILHAKHDLDPPPASDKSMAIESNVLSSNVLQPLMIGKKRDVKTNG
ncbi:MAG: hypothetical protein U5K76_09290 [Woeseiaceae bacterium]|nr:hypothetical protein [Woeseiaceae bacterium]